MLEPKRAGLLSSAPPSLAALTSNELSGGQLLSHALIIFGRHWSSLWRIEDCGRESPLPGTRGSRMCVPAKSLQSCPTLCNPMDSSPPCSSVHGILQARILEWVSMPFTRGSFPPRAGTQVSCASCIVRQVLYHWGHLESCTRGPVPTIKRLCHPQFSPTLEFLLLIHLIDFQPSFL